MGKRRKKTRTHVVEPDTAPKSFVIGKGQSIDALVVDFRKSMEPNTASKLRQRRSNKVKDFIHVAAQLQVTHLVHFSESRTGVNLRIAKIPRGPTLTFHVKSFSLCKDILALQKRPIHLEFFTAPLLVLNNFDQESNHAKLLTATLQNMYPTIKVNTMLLSNVRRVVLYNWNTETQLIEFRQYAITVKQTGLSKSIKTIIQSKVPNLGKFQDVSDYVLRLIRLT
jgi:ribosome biogenesis protein SSF1/2